MAAGLTPEQLREMTGGRWNADQAQAQAKRERAQRTGGVSSPEDNRYRAGRRGQVSGEFEHEASQTEPRRTPRVDCSAPINEAAKHTYLNSPCV